MLDDRPYHRMRENIWSTQKTNEILVGLVEMVEQLGVWRPTYCQENAFGCIPKSFGGNANS